MALLQQSEGPSEVARRRVLHITKCLTAGKQPTVVSFGSVCADKFWYFDELPLGGDKKDKDKEYFKLSVGAKIPTKTIEEAFGGSAANVASGLVKMGLPTTLLAAIGEDSMGQSGVKALQERGVNTAGVVVITEGHTDQSVILRSSNIADRTILTYKGAYLTPSTVKNKLVANANLFLWTSVNAQGAVDAIKKCIETARMHGVKVAAAPSQAMIQTHPLDMIVLMMSTNALSLNDNEALLLTRTNTLQAALDTLFHTFPALEVVQVTRGKNPAILAWRTDNDNIRVVKTFPPKVKIEDTTGAGDAACAGMMYGFVHNSDPEETAKMAAITSMSKIMKRGAANGLLTSEELERLLQTTVFQQSSFTTNLAGLLKIPDKDLME